MDMRVTPIPQSEATERGVGLAIEGLQKQYGARAILRAVDLTIQPGEFVAIVGRSGCGKSTLLRLVAGLEQPSAGAVRHDADAAAIRIMFQDSRLLPWKRVLDNVLIGLEHHQQRLAAELLDQVGLLDRRTEWPARLSGGQRQRVALARALASHPRLLLLDEPLGALDALTRIEMHSLIESLWLKHGFTALLVTHDVHEAVALADRVIVLEDGHVGLDRRIDLARPRQRDDVRFARLEGEILGRLLRRPGHEANDEQRGDASLHRSVDQYRWAV